MSQVFLGASKHLYERLCLLVGWLVGPSVGWSICPHIAYVKIALPQESSRLVWVTLVFTDYSSKPKTLN
jgi:hypothetical protein